MVLRIYFFILFIKTTLYIGCRDVVHRLRVSVKFYHFNTMSEIKGNVNCLVLYFHLKNTIKEYLFRKNIHCLMIIRKEAEIRDFSTFFEVFSNKIELNHLYIHNLYLFKAKLQKTIKIFNLLLRLFC